MLGYTSECKLYIFPETLLNTYFSMPERPEFIGKLRQNDLLFRAKYMFENELLGPESILIRNGVYSKMHYCQF